MEEIRIVDTTLRDGNTSLWAHNMTTGMMHPVLSQMDQAGFVTVKRKSKTPDFAIMADSAVVLV
jgi:pyruvate/oxaloacetate carboxyltransferase